MLYFLICLPVILIVGSAIVVYNRAGLNLVRLARAMLIAAAVSLVVSGGGIYLRAVVYPDASYELAGPFAGVGKRLEQASKKQKQIQSDKSDDWGGAFWKEYRKNMK